MTRSRSLALQKLTNTMYEKEKEGKRPIILDIEKIEKTLTEKEFVVDEDKKAILRDIETLTVIDMTKYIVSKADVLELKADEIKKITDLKMKEIKSLSTKNHNFINCLILYYFHIRYDVAVITTLDGYEMGYNEVFILDCDKIFECEEVIQAISKGLSKARKELK